MLEINNTRSFPYGSRIQLEEPGPSSRLASRFALAKAQASDSIWTIREESTSNSNSEECSEASTPAPSPTSPLAPTRHCLKRHRTVQAPPLTPVTPSSFTTISRLVSSILLYLRSYNFYNTRPLVLLANFLTSVFFCFYNSLNIHNCILLMYYILYS